MTALPLDRAGLSVQHVDVKTFRRPQNVSNGMPASKERQGLKRQAVCLQAVKEKTGEVQDAGVAVEQPRRLPNIFRRAVQALRPEPEGSDLVRFASDNSQHYESKCLLHCMLQMDCP